MSQKNQGKTALENEDISRRLADAQRAEAAQATVAVPTAAGDVAVEPVAPAADPTMPENTPEVNTEPALGTGTSEGEGAVAAQPGSVPETAQAAASAAGAGGVAATADPVEGGPPADTAVPVEPNPIDEAVATQFQEANTEVKVETAEAATGSTATGVEEAGTTGAGAGFTPGENEGTLPQGQTQPMPEAIVTPDTAIPQGGDKLTDFFGEANADKLRSVDQSRVAEEVLPASGAANPGVFRNAEGQARTVAEVRAQFEAPGQTDAAATSDATAALQEAEQATADKQAADSTPADVVDASQTPPEQDPAVQALQQEAPATPDNETFAEGTSSAEPAADGAEQSFVPELDETPGASDSGTDAVSDASAEAPAGEVAEPTAVSGPEGSDEVDGTQQEPTAAERQAEQADAVDAERQADEIISDGTNAGDPPTDKDIDEEPFLDLPDADDGETSSEPNSEDPAAATQDGGDFVDPVSQGEAEDAPVDAGADTSAASEEPAAADPAPEAEAGAETNTSDEPAAPSTDFVDEPGPDAPKPETPGDGEPAPVETADAEPQVVDADGVAAPEGEAAAEPVSDTTDFVEDPVEPASDETSQPVEAVAPVEGAPATAEAGEIPEAGSEQAGDAIADGEQADAAAANMSELAETTDFVEDTAEAETGAVGTDNVPNADGSNGLSADQINSLVNSDLSPEAIVAELKNKGVQGSTGEVAEPAATPEAAVEVEVEQNGNLVPDNEPAVDAPATTETPQQGESLNEATAVGSAEEQAQAQDAEMIEEAEEVSDRMRDLAQAVADTVDNEGDGLPEHEARLHGIAVESLCAQIGYKPPKQLKAVFALENFRDSLTRRLNTQNALREIRDTIAVIDNRIAAAKIGL